MTEAGRRPGTGGSAGGSAGGSGGANAGASESGAGSANAGESAAKEGLLFALWHGTLNLAARPAAAVWLAVLAFTEAIFFPVPVEGMLLPMCLARPRRALYFAAIATAASATGGLAGWALGAWLLEAWAPMAALGYGGAFHEAAALYREHGGWIVFAGGFTPLPFKVVAVASGAMGLNPALFLLFALLSRGVRFFLEAALLMRWGEAMRDFIEKHLPWLSAAALIAAALLAWALH